MSVQRTCDAVAVYNFLSVVPSDKAPAVLIVDVRSKAEFARFAIRGSVNLAFPPDAVSAIKSALDLDRFCCRDGILRWQWRSIAPVVVVHEGEGTARTAHHVEKLIETEGRVRLGLFSMTEPVSAFASRFPFLCFPSGIATNVASCGPFPTLVIDRVFLGDKQNASNRMQLRSLGVTHVVNCAAREVPCFFEGELRYCALAIDDDPSQRLDQAIPESVRFVKEALSSEPSNVIFIHCLAGRSRSASVAIAVVMSALGLEFNDAFSWVASRRRVIDPNPSFISFLSSWKL